MLLLKKNFLQSCAKTAKTRPLYSSNTFPFRRTFSRVVQQRDTYVMSSSSLPVTALSVKERIALRVAERDSWETFKFPTSVDFIKLLWNNPNFLFPKLPTQEYLNRFFPLQSVDWELIRSPRSSKHIQSTWIGHSTLLVQIGGWNILTDPIFSSRCSAVQFAGPERYRRPACTIQELVIKERVGVDMVLISHNHYDHLDYNSVKQLASLELETGGRGIKFLVPLGLKSWFEKYVPESNMGGNCVVELDWHESFTVEMPDSKESKPNKKSAITFTALPMQHWSNRTGFDRDQSLWCGFSIKSMTYDDEKDYDVNERALISERKFLFTGDTGWFEGLHDIGKEYGPFDFAAIPVGAYEPNDFMKSQHINPEEAVDLMIAVKADAAMAIHWGTFPLTPEPVMEPRERLAQAVEDAEKDIDSFVACLCGETVVV